MTLFEEKVNEYRENKRLLEELEAMNEAIKADIICMMQGAPAIVLGNLAIRFPALPPIFSPASSSSTANPISVSFCFNASAICRSARLEDGIATSSINSCKILSLTIISIILPFTFCLRQRFCHHTARQQGCCAKFFTQPIHHV